MPITLSQHDFWSLIKRPANLGSDHDRAGGEADEQTWAYPQQFGQGYFRDIQLRPGLHLEISDLQHHMPVVVECGDRPHPVEVHFDICDDGPKSTSTAGQHWLYSSGLAPPNRSATTLIPAISPSACTLSLPSFAPCWGKLRSQCCRALAPCWDPLISPMLAKAVAPPHR
jgi:hypothetical protein